MTEDTLADGGPTAPAMTDRYGRISLDDDSVVVYDRERTDAWVQSDVAYTLPLRRPTGVHEPPDGTDADAAGSEGE
ncbi:DUF7331 family protein [Halobaculum gomorrense]|uniref:Uncharacterized protein n=1 Tax=Halobaculum gomorrense TaxID=43928 RepID=A0A1M5NV99_9EURY|nr:hypothetical protein [Halobaculum gomorrense]SHG93375.1 hypothetical protein SAMN05443636_1356 [Halobaculum gomorrense]